MDKIIRWLHLSDFHVGKDDYGTRQMFKHIVAHVADIKNRGFLPDFIFITGDLTNHGRPVEYEKFWYEFVDLLQKEVGGGIEQRTFAVPGNHDADRTKNPAFDRNEIIDPAGRYFDPTEQGRGLREMLIPRFQNYLEHDITYKSEAFAKQEGAFVVSDCVRDTSIGIVGLNTAWLCKDNLDEHKITPGTPILRAALDSIKKKDIKIVLGHHPIEWFVKLEQRTIKSLLGQNLAIYLHGHMHDAWTEPHLGGGQEFMTVQAGAAFQCREGEQWKNGLVWAEANITAKTIKFQAMQWVAAQQTWTIVTDAFHESYRTGDWWVYPLPTHKPVASTSNSSLTQPPSGWEIADISRLSSYTAALNQNDAVLYFNGAVPDWQTALSTSVPRREIVERLVGYHSSKKNIPEPRFILLLGAGCEGKTTAILQACHAIMSIDASYRVLRRRNDFIEIDTASIISIISSGKWILMLDEVDTAATSLHRIFQQIPSSNKSNVVVLAACRDSDWLSSNANAIPWNSVCDYTQERLSGITPTDAASITEAWSNYGNEGLGRLSAIEQQARSALLIEKSHQGAKTDDGTFFGALLAVRFGDDLREHARLLLSRLDQRKISEQYTLKDALAFISIMHAQGLEFLSHPVLAKVLNCPANKLRRDVIVPLGKEAASTSTSQFIFTRHRLIAEALLTTLAEDYYEDVNSLYIALTEAALSAYKEGAFVPELAKWRYDLPKHFVHNKNIQLAVAIGRTAVWCEPTNELTFVGLSSLYREAGEYQAAVDLFRNSQGINIKHRGYFREWAVAEGQKDHEPTKCFLAYYALSDECHPTRIKNDDAVVGLSCLIAGLKQAFISYHSIELKDACLAAIRLALALKMKPEEEEFFDRANRELSGNKIPRNSTEELFQALRNGIYEAQKIGIEQAAMEILSDAEIFNYNGLQTLIENAVRQGYA